jgi:hypothetical protein
MADHFPNTFWPVRYFPQGYWGVSQTNPNDMFAAIYGAAYFTATADQPSQYSGGSSWHRTWLEPELVKFIPIPAPRAANLKGKSTLRATITARGELSATVDGSSTLTATASRRYSVSAANKNFWLMAA